MKAPVQALQVAEIVPGEPAAGAGFATGDVITHIAGIRVYSTATLFDGLEHAADLDSFAVRYLRGGEAGSASVPVQLFAAATADAPAKPGEATAPSEPVAQPDGTRDTLEELERLADLRDRGVLTDEEFEELKARVLAAP